MCTYIYIYIYIYIYGLHIHGNHINFRSIYFSSYDNLKVTLKQRFDVCLFQVSSWHLPLQGLFAVKFYSFALKID